MKISTRGRYALRLMIDIGMNDQDSPVRIKDIAQRQEISEKYLEQIVSVLNKAGFVRSSRGPQGGYRLARAPKDYTAGEILTLIEGSLAPVACLDTPSNDCQREAVCPTLILWKKINEAVHGVVDSVTLEDLLKWQDDLLPDKD
ncbi:MAG: Rrf2 family transcriptional regulator [Schwartzia sp.]|nr:Rrf2 family transcriptional regulator [Schwartzia sp. (in: firmicutes)]